MTGYVDAQTGAGGGGHSWVDIRQQLFGRQRQREAQEALLALLTTLQTHLAAGGAAAGATREAPRARAAVLRALTEGVNGLVRWHREQAQAVTGAGARERRQADLAPLLLARLRREYPLFEAARVHGGALECADVVEAVGQLRGEHGDAFYHEALGGLSSLLLACFEHLASDEPTAPVVAELEAAWVELLAEVEALAPGAAAGRSSGRAGDRAAHAFSSHAALA
jgi:hypothetical protein